MVKSFVLYNLVPFPQVLTNKFEGKLKIGAQLFDTKLGHTLNYKNAGHSNKNVFYPLKLLMYI